MEPLIHTEEETRSSARLTHQALSFLMHTALALGSWLALMFAGYLLNPPGVSQFLILVLSILVPLAVGYFVTRLRRDPMAEVVWLVGLIWVLIATLWILDMPTGPNQCFKCDATEKLSRTFFSLPKPSGLIDDDGPFLGTWPAASLIGYAVGARLALRRPKSDD